MTNKVEFNMSHQVAEAMAHIDKERRNLNISLLEVQERSGISVNSTYAWRGQMRSPTIEKLIPYIELFGFELVLRRKES